MLMTWSWHDQAKEALRKPSSVRTCFGHGFGAWFWGMVLVHAPGACFRQMFPFEHAATYHSRLIVTYSAHGGSAKSAVSLF